MYTVGSVVIFVVCGFAVYRWQNGEHTRAAINLLIVAMVGVCLLLGRIERFNGVVLRLFGIIVSGGSLSSALLVSTNGLLWALLALIQNVLTLSRRWALCLNTIIIVVLASATHLYDSAIHLVSWVTVAILTTAFSLTSMNQLRAQREQLKTQANLDPLTGAGNRRLMTTHLREFISGRRSGERCGTLMVFDLDHFKRVNDQHGHEEGDRVLKDVVANAQSVLRAEDGLYRMGGEEFVVLLRGMDEAAALSHLPTLHARVSGQVVTPSGAVELSAGAATLQGTEDWSEWLARADRALYNAKKSGRNKLVFSEAD